MKKENVKCYGVRFIVAKDGREAGRAFLRFNKNNRDKSYLGLLEDVFISEEVYDQGVGGELVTMIIREARVFGCCRLIVEGKNGGVRDGAHVWYTRLGFQDYGTEFRLDL